MSVTRNDEGPAGPQAVPEKLLAIERIARTVDERRPESHNRQARLRTHAEQQPLRRSLVPYVRTGVVIRRQRIAFLMVQSVAVGGHAGNKDVAAQTVATGAHRRLHLFRRGAALPVVNIVEYHIETARRQ